MPSPIVVRFGAVLSFIVIGILLIRSFYDRLPLSYTTPSQLVQAGSPIPWHPDRWSTASSRNETLEKACLVMLVRNDELHPARFSIRQIEDRFNARFGYDWVFLNDQPFTDEFINYTSALTSGQAFYGQIPQQHWSYPSFIDQGKATKAMADMDAQGIIYGGSLSYRHMCRFNSGFFYRHELMQKYDYYFRIEPYVEFYCDMYEDPFKFMRENGKKYGWVMSMYEFEATVTTLWQTTKAFAKKFPQHIAPKNSLSFMVHDATSLENSEYNLCHFWSNFEIADLNFFRSQAYTDYFEWLDKAGGFFYERWGDAPVHSIAAGLMLNNSELHHFSKVGYRHNPYTRCPPNTEDHFSAAIPSGYVRWQMPRTKDKLTCTTSRSGAVQELQSSLKSIPASQIPAFLSQKDDRGNTCLHFAAANGHLPIVTELLKSIEQISINSTNEGGNTPLHWACLNGHLGVVKELLKHGADTKVKNRGGRQPVDEAESQNKENCVLWLLALDMANEKADAQGDDYEEAEVKLTAGDVGQGEPQQIVLNAHAKPDYKRDARLARVMDSVKIDGLADLDDID